MAAELQFPRAAEERQEGPTTAETATIAATAAIAAFSHGCLSQDPCRDSRATTAGAGWGIQEA